MGKLLNVPKAKNICDSAFPDTHKPCGYCEPCRQNMKDFSAAYPIQERIADALRGKGSAGRHYHSLMDFVFPHEYCPSAYNRPSRGGPHGCAFALGKAIRLGGYKTRYEGYDRFIYMPDDHPKSKKPSTMAGRKDR